jgi:hypothetical protein
MQLQGFFLSFPVSIEEKHCTQYKHVYTPICIVMQLMLLSYLRQETYRTALHVLVKMENKIPYILYIYNLQLSLLRDSGTN